MNISQKSAMEIVTEVSNIINQHINMMDENGIIIASTNPERIGKYHAAAYRVISEGLEQLVINNDEEYEGARKGINLPLLLHGTIVGVIGITGEQQDVVKYGQIVKKLTEILITENNLKDQRKLDDRIRSRFLYDLLYDDSPAYSSALIERGMRLDIDINILRRVVVAEIDGLNNFSYTVDGQLMIDKANKAVGQIVKRDSRNIFIKTASQMICLVVNRSDEEMLRFAEEIRDNVKALTKMNVNIGIDRREENINKAYEQAKKAIKSCLYTKRSICFYNEIAMELFMDEISPNIKKEFILRVFRNIDEKDMESWVYLLQIYFQCNGSICRASEKLYIHKNTLQNKIKKLCELTGYDPRKLSDASLYYLAIQFYTDATV